jgi:hypothetical protein
VSLIVLVLVLESLGAGLPDGSVRLQN